MSERGAHPKTFLHILQLDINTIHENNTTTTYSFATIGSNYLCYMCCQVFKVISPNFYSALSGYSSLLYLLSKYKI